MEAYILLETQPGFPEEKAQQLADIGGVMSCNFVTGPYDIIVKVSAADVVKLGDLVVAKIQSVKGVLRTTTCIATSRDLVK